MIIFMRQLELFHFKVNRTCWTGGRAQVSFLRDSEVKKLGGGDREELPAWVSQTRERGDGKSVGVEEE